ncbi:MAG: hypothetical protein RML84_09330 [Anaerolineae bacterium]|nr:hypothetical protein [Anaerolineae bacterium]
MEELELINQYYIDHGPIVVGGRSTISPLDGDGMYPATFVLRPLGARLLCQQIARGYKRLRDFGELGHCLAPMPLVYTSVGALDDLAAVARVCKQYREQIDSLLQQGAEVSGYKVVVGFAGAFASTYTLWYEWRPGRWQFVPRCGGEELGGLWLFKNRDHAIGTAKREARRLGRKAYVFEARAYASDRVNRCDDPDVVELVRLEEQVASFSPEEV